MHDTCQPTKETVVRQTADSLPSDKTLPDTLTALDLNTIFETEILFILNLTVSMYCSYSLIFLF